MLGVITSILFSLQSSPIPVKVHTHNYTQIQKIDGRDPLFGVKETVEELLIEKGYNPTDSGETFDVHVSIDSIYSPQQLINIAGLQWLRKDYIVKTAVCIGSSCFKGIGERKTFIFAMFLNVENNQVPLNRKAFSKALQSSLRESTKLSTEK